MAGETPLAAARALRKGHRSRHSARLKADWAHFADWCSARPGRPGDRRRPYLAGLADSHDYRHPGLA